MELNLLYLKLLLITQCFCVSSRFDGGTKFVRKNQQVTFDCSIGGSKKINFWNINGQHINSPNQGQFIKDGFEATVFSKESNYILNVTLISKRSLDILCNNTDEDVIFKAIQLYNDTGNLYPSDETPNAIKDNNFTLKCTTKNGSTTTWYTGTGEIIAKYIGTKNQNKTKYFGNRQETSCQTKICTLSIIGVSLDEDNMSIICSSFNHTSMFNITVFVLPKSVKIKEFSDRIPVEKQNKSYECIIQDSKPEFTVLWQLIKKDGTKKIVSKHISNSSSRSGKLTSLSSTLTLTLNKVFKELQCVAYIPGENELSKTSEKLGLFVKYSPGKNMTLNISKGGVCVGTSTKLQCSWKGGDPPASVTLMYNNASNTSKEEVELNVILSKPLLNSTVKCQGTHIAANVSRTNNLTIYYPPESIEIQSNEPFLEGDKNRSINCKASNGYPGNYTYMWGPDNVTSKTVELPELSQDHNNKIYTCYASNFCNIENRLHKKHWINVEYYPDISMSENITLFENQETMLKCSAKGNPTPEVRWECGNQSFPSNSLLTFTRRNSSNVSCVADANSTKNGMLTSRKKINILLKYAPVINIHISNETNNSIIINCTAFDGSPAYYNYTLKHKWVDTIKNVYDKNIIQIKNNFNNSGTWECHVKNYDFQRNKSLKNEIEMKPIFNQSSSSKNRNVSHGESVIFKECFYSYPKSNVKWKRNEQLINSSQYSTTDCESCDFPFKGSCTMLRIDDIKDNDFGIYTLIVQNTKGKHETIFKLISKDTTETPLGIIIGCTVAIVILLLILGLLAYKCHQIKGVERNEFSSTKAINVGNAYATDEPTDVHVVANTIYEPLELNVQEDIYTNISQLPNNVEDLYAKVNKPKTADVKPTNVKDAKVNKPKTAPVKPTNVEDLYATVNKPKTADVKPTNVKDAKVNKPKTAPVKPTNTKDSGPNDIYENMKQENSPEPIKECDYAELEFINNADKSKPKPKPQPQPQGEETIYAAIVLDN